MGEQTLLIAGTRPEVVKLAPVHRALVAAGVPTSFAVTAQHRDLLDQMVASFGLTIDHDLDLMRAGEGLPATGARILDAVSELLAETQPGRVVVQGDTTTAAMSAVASHHHHIPLAHVEAGLRTDDPNSPYPEETNRRIITAIADQHFAPTVAAADRLRAEGVDPNTVHCVGNTVVDALRTIAPLAEERDLAVRANYGIPPGATLVLCTVHRRESLAGGIDGICRGLAALAEARPEAALLLPVHPNPGITEAIHRHLAGLDNVHLAEPFDYLSFIALVQRAQLAVTDSGGVQEEAPTLGVPVVVVRERTERPEGVAAGAASLVGFDPERILHESVRMLERDTSEIPRDLYGDGHAASRIAAVLSALVSAHQRSHSG